MNKEHVGLFTHRLKDNPKEQAFADAWERWNKNSHILGYLIGDGTKAVQPTPDQVTTAATVVQWLGSPVGQQFLNSVKPPTSEATRG